MEIREINKVEYAVVDTDIGTFRVFKTGEVGEYLPALKEWVRLTPQKHGLTNYERIQFAGKYELDAQE